MTDVDLYVIGDRVFVNGRSGKVLDKHAAGQCLQIQEFSDWTTGWYWVGLVQRCVEQ